MVHADDDPPPDGVCPRSTLSYGDTIGVFQIGRVHVKQRYACIRRDQFELTAEMPFPPTFRDYLTSRGPVRGTALLYTLDIPQAFQLTVAPNAGRAVFVPRLATELDWQKKMVVELASALDEILRSM